jgi:plasmid rolling circle replication initiator protein Rep
MLETHDSECLQQSEGSNATIIERVLLRQLSPRDVTWDDRRAETDRVKELYSGTIYDRLAGRLGDCSGRLEFGYDLDSEGKQRLRLHAARFCRVRTCPVCQWRRSLMWRARAFKILPQVVDNNPNHRFIFLTLTVRNCQIGDLRATIGKMNQAWMRLTKRKQWPAVGWIRSVEVTRGQDGTAHPHFHCLLMVTSTYFKGTHYLSQEAWTELWEKSMKIDYKPIVHVQAVRPKKKEDQTMFEAICETLKYSVKPADLIGDPNNEPTDKDREFLVELTAQLHKTRAVATGGILKEYLRELENEPEDLIHGDDNPDEEDSSIASVVFDWENKPKKYLMNNDI